MVNVLLHPFFSSANPRLEATAPVDVGGIAFPIRYPTRPVDFIL